MQIKYTTSDDVTVEPVTLDEAKLHLRVDTTDEDDLITALISAARETLESETNRSFVRREHVMKFDCFPTCISITLVRGDVDPDTIAIEYVDENEVEQTLNASEYWVDTHGSIARIVTRNTWPGTFAGRPNNVTITYDAGYITIPPGLKQALLLLIGHLYENRQAVANGNMSDIPLGLRYMVGPYIIIQDVTNEGYYRTTR
jgi:uncharacterized phiE125 gp8 family phage protein